MSRPLIKNYFCVFFVDMVVVKFLHHLRQVSRRHTLLNTKPLLPVLFSY